jgi:hypothetical protein
MIKKNKGWEGGCEADEYLRGKGKAEVREVEVPIKVSA